MTGPHNAHWENRSEVCDSPAKGDELSERQYRDAGDGDCADGEGILEALEHARHFDEEVAELGFFGGCAPLHVVLEHVCEERGGDVER